MTATYEPKRVAFLLCFGLAILSSQALAQQAPDALIQARELFDHQEYRQVVETLEPVVTEESLPVARRVAALELIGVAHLVRQRQAPAQDAFERLLALDPGYEPQDPSFPPRVADFVNLVRDTLEPAPTVTLDHTPPNSAQAGEAVELVMDLPGPLPGMSHMVLFAREEGANQFEQHRMRCEMGRCTTEVPTSAETSLLDYFAEARAPSEHCLGRAGTAEAPLSVALEAAPQAPPPPPPPPPERRWYQRWWVWTIIGVGLAGAATGVALGVVMHEPDTPGPGTMGTAELP